MFSIYGNDWLAAGNGRDVVIGGGGSDEVRGEGGRDILAGDYLRVDYANGLVTEIETPQQFNFSGAGDTIRTGYDGDFVFGGTQFNRFEVSASVDIIFETFGRVLTEQGIGIDKVTYIFNQGVSGSLLDDRVADGQVLTKQDREYSADGYGFLDRSSIEASAPERAENQAGEDLLKTFLAAQLPVGSGQQNFMGSSVTQESDDVDADLLNLSGISMKPDLPANPAAVIDALQTAAKSPDVKADQITDKVGFVSDYDSMPVDILSVLELGAGAAAVKSLGLRRYGPVKVGSLEQRLRVWDGSRFVLRGKSAADHLVDM